MKAIITGIILLSSLGAYAQQSECKNFKNGKFKIVTQDYGVFILERKGSKQIEYLEGSSTKMEFKVKWLDDCTYTLQYVKTIEGEQRIDIPKEQILMVEILGTDENGYYQRTSSNMFEQVLESKVIKI